MSSESGSSSASKGGMSNKSAKTNPVVQGIRADQYAKDKLGIRTTVAGPVTGASTSPTGFISTTSSNQMYGTEYQAARGEYLASQGLATARTITDNFGNSYTTYDPAIKRDGKLVYTNESRAAMEAAKREPVPLSRQMYDSQQKFTQIAGVIGTALTGMPSFFSAAYYASKKPYSKYVGEYMSGAKKGVDNQTITSSKNQTNEYITTSAQMNADFNEAQKGDEKALKRVQALAKSGEAGSPNRKFLVTSAKTFLGSMKSGDNF